MKRFSEVMKEFNNARNFKEKLEEVRAVEAWNAVVTDDIAKNTSPKYIRNGVLHVKAKSPAWAQELSGFTPKLKELLNDYLAAPIVQEIKFSCESFMKAAGEKDAAARPELDDIIIGEQEVEEAAETTSSIHDDDLRERLASLIIQSKKLNRWRDTEGWTACVGCGRQIPAAEKGCRRCFPK
ncbi:MAG: DUF721 domain-containing protein [Candidatus Aquicultor sp.]|nr:DUF721 domain-containing protein [Candidatus Aquicultor sp.]